MVVAAGLIMLTGAAWIDPVASLAIGAVIVVSTWGLLKESAALALDAVPPGVDAGAIAGALAALPGVLEVHDLHIWALSTTQPALTAHLVTTAADHALVPQACVMMQRDFAIEHCTFQVETVQTAERCKLRPEGVV